jgi:hypothetical protein
MHAARGSVFQLTARWVIRSAGPSSEQTSNRRPASYLAHCGRSDLPRHAKDRILSYDLRHQVRLEPGRAPRHAQLVGLTVEDPPRRVRPAVLDLHRGGAAVLEVTCALVSSGRVWLRRSWTARRTARPSPSDAPRGAGGGRTPRRAACGPEVSRSSRSFAATDSMPAGMRPKAAAQRRHDRHASPGHRCISGGSLPPPSTGTPPFRPSCRRRAPAWLARVASSVANNVVSRGAPRQEGDFFIPPRRPEQEAP